MQDEEIAHLIRELSNEDSAYDKRVSAARALSETDSPDALDCLVHIATGDDVDDALSRAVGESIAHILIRTEQIDQVPLHHFREPVFEAYYDAIGRFYQLGETIRSD